MIDTALARCGSAGASPSQETQTPTPGWRIRLHIPQSPSLARVNGQRDIPPEQAGSLLDETDKIETQPFQVGTRAVSVEKKSVVIRRIRPIRFSFSPPGSPLLLGGETPLRPLDRLACSDGDVRSHVRLGIDCVAQDRVESSRDQRVVLVVLCVDPDNDEADRQRSEQFVIMKLNRLA